MDPMTIMLLLSAAGAMAGPMMQKKPESGQRIIPPGTSENPGYAGKTPPLVVGATPPDNRMAQGLGSLGSVLGAFGGMGGMGGGAGAGAAGAMGSAAPMAPQAFNAMGNTSASNIGFGSPQVSGNRLMMTQNQDLYGNYFGR